MSLATLPPVLLAILFPDADPVLVTRQGRQPRRLAVVLMLAVTAVSLPLAWTVSAWFLIAVPFEVVVAYAAWLGLSNDEFLDVLATGDDPGRGSAGIY